MPSRRWFPILALSVVLGGFAVGHAVATRQEIATVAISVPILLIAAATLWFTIPKRAVLKVDRLSEANLTDLIFFIYPQPNPDNRQQTPIDYLLQLHVAVSNLGDRKAVLSGITIDGFHNQSGAIIHLPGAQAVIGGSRWLQQSGWLDGQLRTSNISTPPPYILESDDVIVVRFRTRRAIDWTDRWTLDAIREFLTPLRNPIISAFGTTTWRRGGTVIREPFQVQLVVEQQQEYVALIETLTQGLSTLPTVPQEHLNIAQLITME